MDSRNKFLAIVVTAMILAPTAALADDLTGAERMLCTSVQATVCFVEGDCEVGPPWNWGVPQFIQVDLKGKMLSTTKASHESRQTPFRSLERADGMIFIQGIEAGRAFSFAIHEATGQLSAAVARDQITVSVFGACTPTP